MTGVQTCALPICQSTASKGRTLVATANAGVAGSAVQAATQTTFGGAVSALPDLSAGSNGLQAFAFADGQPKARAVNTQLASHAQVAAAVNAAGLKPMGLGSMGANVADAATAAQDYTATTEYSFTLAGPGGLTLGLLDFTGYAQGGAFALTFDVSNSGTSLVHQSFDTLSSADAYLDRKSTRLNSSHIPLSRMPSSA